MTDARRPAGPDAPPVPARDRHGLRVQEAEAIIQCLTYLEIEASKLGLGMAAHLIGVAAATVEDSISTAVAARSARAGDGRLVAKRGKIGSHRNRVRSNGIGPNGTKSNGSGNGVDE